MKNGKMCVLFLVLCSLLGGGCVEAVRDGVTGGVKSGVSDVIGSTFQLVLDAVLNGQ